MTRLLRRGVTIAVVPFVASVIAARPHGAHPMAGAWTIEYERGRTITNGEATVVMGKGRLELAERGDSLVGTVSPEDMHDGRPATPFAIAGAAASGEVALRSALTSHIMIGAEANEATITMDWKLAVRGDSLTGTLTRSSPMIPFPPEPSPVKGVRTR